MECGSDEWADAYNRWYHLRQARNKINEYYSSVTKPEWESAKAKGKYSYEFVLGEDEEFFKGAGNMYYVVLDGYQTQRVNDNSWQYIITTQENRNDGEDVANEQRWTGYFGIRPAFTEDDYFFTASDDDYNELFTVDENNVVYLEVMSRNNMGDESYRALGYVNQIVLYKDGEIAKVLFSQAEPDHTIDEGAWLENIKQAVIAGEDVNSVFPLGELQPISFDLDGVDLSTVSAGEYAIRYTYKMYGKTYTEEEPWDMEGWIDYTVVAPLPTASIEFRTGEGEFGRYNIVVPETLENGSWRCFTVEVRDENDAPVGTYNQDTYQEYALSMNYSVKVKLTADDWCDYYTDGEWSDWFYCLPIKLATPSGFSVSYEEDGVSVSWQFPTYATKFQLSQCYRLCFLRRRVMPSIKHKGCVGAPGSHKSTWYLSKNERSTAGLSA